MNKTLLLDCSEAVARVRAGDAEAFAVIVEQFQSPIVNYLFRLTGDVELARDLAQETFIHAYKGLTGNRPVCSFRPWLYRIATNTALQHLRRQARVPFVPLDDRRVPGRGLDPADEDVNTAAVHEALLRVPEKLRVCVVLHFVDGFKHREIAGMLGISEDAARMRVNRGCAEFRRVYRASGGALP